MDYDIKQYQSEDNDTNIILSKQEIIDKCVKTIKLNISDSICDNYIKEDEKIYELIDEMMFDLEEIQKLSIKSKLEIRTRVFNSFRKMEVLQDLLDDKSITEIMINGTDNIFVEKDGVSIKLDKKFENIEQLEDIIQQIVSRINRTVNTATPIVDARLLDGSRVHILLPPVSLIGPVITIRKFPEVISMDKLIKYKSLDKEVAIFLEKLVKSGYNIFISGGTSSGKTTFLNALSAYIPKDDRVITIEDSAELNLSHIKNLVSLESRNSNTKGEGEISISELIKASLRMNPDRIVVGEIRSKEAIDMLQAMNTGHDGSLSTGHSNSALDMLSRIETMVLSGIDIPLPAIKSQIASAIDIIIHLAKLRDKSRRVLSIVEIGEYINGDIQTNIIYEFEEAKESKKEQVIGKLIKKNELKNQRKLISSGYLL